MRKSAVKHPVLFSLILMLLFFITMLIGSYFVAFAPEFFRFNGDIIQQFTAESVVCLVGIAFTFIFGYGKIWYNTSKFWSGLLSSGYFLVTYSLSAIITLIYEAEERGGLSGSLLPIWRIIFLPITVLEIGIAEECFFRGVISNLFWDKHAKDPAGVWTAAIYSGLMFGALHIMNLIGSEPSGVLAQITAVTVMGVAMTAIYYRCRNIWVMVVLHAFMDFCAMISIGLFGGSLSGQISDYDVLTSLEQAIPFIIVTLILLRKSKVLQMLTGDNAIGYIPPQSGMPGYSIDLPSSPESKRSLKRAIVIFIVFCIVTAAGAMVTEPGFEAKIDTALGNYIIDCVDSGTFTDEPADGHQVSFYVDKAGTYEVTIDCEPSESAVDMVFQILENGEVIYQSAYGGKCLDTFTVDLSEGEHWAVFVYSNANASRDASYHTELRIKPV